MTRLAPLLALGLLFTVAPDVARGMWGFGPEPAEVDLVVEGTLVSLNPSVARVHGHTYDVARGTIVVTKVIYAEQGAEVGATLELFSAQRADTLCPRVHHAAYLFRPGVWLLQRTATPGVYTSYMAESQPQEALVPEARVRVSGGRLDPATGTLELEVRYENFSPAEASFGEVSVDDLGELRGAMVTVSGWRGRDEIRALLPVSPEQPRRLVDVPPWRYSRSTVRLPLPAHLAGATCLSAETAGLRVGRAWIYGVTAEEVDLDDPPLFLGPEAVLTTVLPTLSLGWLLLAAALGAVPLVTRGRTWRWTPFARRLGGLTSLGALLLVPWSVVGFGPATAPVAVAADAALLLAWAGCARARGDVKSPSRW
ncbi:MAG: hypothetical protein M9894_17430 [Planctomycetes bacterium]|nr:hypothetical protein [Planctomycetota bacterium]